MAWDVMGKIDIGYLSRPALAEKAYLAALYLLAWGIQNSQTIDYVAMPFIDSRTTKTIYTYSSIVQPNNNPYFVCPRTLVYKLT
jgi:hypothetical protein